MEALCDLTGSEADVQRHDQLTQGGGARLLSLTSWQSRSSRAVQHLRVEGR